MCRRQSVNTLSPRHSLPTTYLNKYKQSKQNRRKRSFKWILQACLPFSRWNTCGSDRPARTADSSFSLVAQDRDVGCGVETRPLSSALGGGVTHPPSRKCLFLEGATRLPVLGRQQL